MRGEEVHLGARRVHAEQHPGHGIELGRAHPALDREHLGGAAPVERQPQHAGRPARGRPEAQEQGILRRVVDELAREEPVVRGLSLARRVEPPHPVEPGEHLARTAIARIDAEEEKRDQEQRREARERAGEAARGPHER